MTKAFFLFPTIVFGLAFSILPNLNGDPTPDEQAGKIIKATQIPRGDYEIKTVVIDPGHGGHDPGCLGASSREKHLALAIGKYFAEALKENYPNLKVIMTRSTDVFIPLNERAEIATRNKADLFISIHCNYIPKYNKTSGIETYVLGLHATKENLEVAKRENSSILLEANYKETYGYDPNSPEAHIMMSMFQNAFLDQSILFAQKVQNQVTIEASRRDRGVKQAGFLVLRYATMPSVLVETGFLSNREEENYLKSTKGQKEMANGLLLAFADYKMEMETGRNSNGLANVKKLEVDRDERMPELTEATTIERPEETLTASRTSEEGKVVAVRQDNVPPAKRVNEEPTIRKNSGPVQEPVPDSPAKILPSIPIESSPQTKAPTTSQSAGIQYCVQLAATPTLLNVTTGRWANVEYLIEVVQEDRLYKYQVRNFAALEEAGMAKQKLKSIGFNDAFVVAYKNGVRYYPEKK